MKPKTDETLDERFRRYMDMALRGESLWDDDETEWIEVVIPAKMTQTPPPELKIPVKAKELADPKWCRKNLDEDGRLIRLNPRREKIVKKLLEGV